MQFSRPVAFSLITFAVFLAYFPILANHFTLDDAILLSAPYPQELSECVYLLTEPVPHQLMSHYRPLVFTSFVWDRVFWENNPVGFHLTHLWLASLCSLTAFLFLKQFFSSSQAFVAALFFAVHPAHSEAIISIYNRSQLFSSLGIFISLLCWSRAFYSPRFRFRWVLGSAIALLFGCFAKESAFITPLIVVLLRFSFPFPKQSSTSLWWIGLGVQGIACTLYLALRYFALGAFSFQRVDGFLPETASWWFHYQNSCWIFTQYLMLLIWPISLSCDYPLSPVAFHGMSLFYPFFAVFFLFLLFRGKKEAKGFVFSFFWILLNLLPTLHLVPIQISLAERLLYPASLGMMCVFSLLLHRYTSPCLFPKLVWGFVLIFVVFTALRCLDWKTEDTLWKETLNVFPNSYRARIYLGAKLQQQQHSGFFYYYEDALSLSPNLQNRLLIYYNFAYYYLEKDQFRFASLWLEKILEQELPHLPTLLLLGDYYFYRQEWKQAVYWYQQFKKPRNRWDKQFQQVQQKLQHSLQMQK